MCSKHVVQPPSNARGLGRRSQPHIGLHISLSWLGKHILQENAPFLCPSYWWKETRANRVSSSPPSTIGCHVPLCAASSLLNPHSSFPKSLFPQHTSAARYHSRQQSAASPSLKMVLKNRSQINKTEPSKPHLPFKLIFHIHPFLSPPFFQQALNILHVRVI